MAVFATFIVCGALVLVLGDLEALDKWLGITGLSTAALGGWVLKGIQEWRAGSDLPDARQLEVAAADLATAVHRTWSREAVNRGLTSPLPIAVRMRAADPRIAAHPAQWHEPVGAPMTADVAGATLAGTVADVVGLYRRVATGRLVIVGEPGGGKSGAAVLLLLSLSASRSGDSLIPVWLPLASWDPAASTVEAWMVGQLITSYGTPPSAAAELVAQGRVLPVLDGLDEIPQIHRAAAVTGLGGLGTAPLVLTCRTEEYIAAVAAGVLAAAAVVEVVPVGVDVMVAYLTQSGSADTARWDRLIAALRAGPPSPCSQTLSSPLMLSLARVVYQAPTSDPSELLDCSTAEQVEDRLLDGLVPAVYGRDADDTPPDRASRWLSFFADRLALIGPGVIAWWRLPQCLADRHLRSIAGLGYGLAAGLWATVAFAWLGPFALFGPACIVVGPIVGLLAARLRTELPGVPRPALWRVPNRRDLVGGLRSGARTGIVVGPACGLGLGVLGLTYQLESFRLEDDTALAVVRYLLWIIWYSILIGLSVAVVRGLTLALAGQPRDSVTPLSSHQADRRAGRQTAIILGLAMLLILELALLATDPSMDSVLFGLVVGLPIALGIVVWVQLRGSAHAWFAVAAMLLVRQGLLPKRPLLFLEDAYRRGVLRKVGAVYEFRHSRLAERLRTTGQDIAEVRPPSPRP
ncbi:hypothetical protein SAMN05421812_107219 [Asanoa hainanensis]|uniref:NACHT domain-containing protein n=1 Tax=Asanoa hainanensis TaxID=560556 RepID=A0A239N3D0_9ACTN|nr:hypothetical protein [Asanoa hainanensis]SNT49537.1 hypothetical protein SAMN05421812_107219 [Asanoa hainanensis]